MLRLHEAFRALGLELPAGGGAPVTGLACDTRKLKPGEIFVAISGHRLDGHRFAAEAAAKGAVAIVAERPVDAGVPVALVEDARAALARLAHELSGRPSERVRVAGVTGTKGKTTTTYLLRSIVRASGSECGLLGTIAVEAFGRSTPADNTTPDPCAIQSFLASLDREDGGYAVMEVSSHALVQRRVEGVRFAAAAFTNLSGEHLDYHRTMEAYRDAKGLLFEALEPHATAVLNLAQEPSLRYRERTRARVLGYGIAERAPGADIRATGLRLGPRETRFVLHLPGAAPGEVRLALVGAHNVENALAAAGLAHALGIGAPSIVRGLEALTLVPGRLEPVDEGQPFRVLVDYAHTDDALEKVLVSLRAVSAGRIVCMFGCGGDRDRTKRPRMGRTAERLADEVVVTSDNPRSEEPRAIIDEILAGIERRDRVTVEPDRRAAIAAAVSRARAGDIVLIAGKGHETYQILGDRTVSFDDREVAREALRAALGREPARA